MQVVLVKDKKKITNSYSHKWNKKGEKEQEKNMQSKKKKKKLARPATIIKEKKKEEKRSKCCVSWLEPLLPIPILASTLHYKPDPITIWIGIWVFLDIQLYHLEIVRTVNMYAHWDYFTRTIKPNNCHKSSSFGLN